VTVSNGLTGSGQSPVTGSCEHDNDPSGCVKTGNFLAS
jgi:hypothetical protein